MRGVAILSILLLTACTPARKPPEMSLNDPNAIDPSGSTSKADNPSETWGSSETATSTHSTPTPPPDPTPSDKPATGTKPPSDDGPHVPASFGGSAYDRPALETILKRAARQVKSNCGAATDESGAVSGPWGKTTITVKLGHNGHSKGGTLPPPFDGKTTGRCAVIAFTNLIYAPFAGSDTDVDWPLEIVKP
jgi:hypothetical protein